MGGAISRERGEGERERGENEEKGMWYSRQPVNNGATSRQSPKYDLATVRPKCGKGGWLHCIHM